MRALAALTLVLPMLLAACAPAHGTAKAAPAGLPGGVVSLDYCADQMVLGLVAPRRILGVSPEADSDATFSAPRARGIARLRPSVEEIVKLRPRYAVRLYGGAPGIDRQLAAVGITVVQLGMADTLDAVPGELARVGAALGVGAQADRLAAAFRADVSAARAVAASRPAPTLLYMTPGDVTTGGGGLIGDVIAASGFRSVRTAPGWGSLPVEAMVRRPPDAVLRAFFDSNKHQQDRWSSASHPRLRSIAAAAPTLTVPGSALACGNWMAGDAVRQLAALRARIAVQP